MHDWPSCSKSRFRRSESKNPAWAGFVDRIIRRPSLCVRLRLPHTASALAVPHHSRFQQLLQENNFQRRKPILSLSQKGHLAESTGLPQKRDTGRHHEPTAMNSSEYLLPFSTVSGSMVSSFEGCTVLWRETAEFLKVQCFNGDLKHFDGFLLFLELYQMH